MLNRQTLFHTQCIFPHADFVLQVNQFSWRTLNSYDLTSSIQSCGKSNLPLLFSLIKEVIFRCTGLTLFDTQLSAAYSMMCGNITQLPTGEGKTLAAVVAAACFALQGRHIHILTFNDYLSKRDYTQSRDVFEMCCLTSGGGR